MIIIGQYNTLRVARFVDFGAYLDDDNGDESMEVLIPSRYIPEGTAVNDTLKVFIYKDSEDRIIATTETPYATVGEFAFLKVVQVNDTGAFLDWGLSKDLLVPYAQQRTRMKQGGTYLVYIYLDHATMRVAASAKVEKFLGNVMPDYKVGDKVQCLVFGHTEIGYNVIVDNLHKGMIYDNEVFRHIEIEETLTGYVKRVRDDGKIDITLSAPIRERIDNLSERILSFLKMNRNRPEPLSDKISPDEIKSLFGCSKKDFKKAVGLLYREHKIVLDQNSVINLTEE